MVASEEIEALAPVQTHDAGLVGVQFPHETADHVREILHSLGGIEESVMLFRGDRGRPRARQMLTDMDLTQQRLYEVFGLDAFAPKA